MTRRARRPPFATVALLALLLPLGVPVHPTAAQDDAPTPETLRVYGCSDDIAPQAARAPSRDGIIDCQGDQVRLEHAWLAGGADPFLRSALGPRDQTIALSLSYLPTAWAPAPGTEAQRPAIADPGAPGLGLFDVAVEAANGRFDPALVSDEDVAPSLDDNDLPDPLDREPYADGAPDFYAQNDGRHPEADLYFPAVALRYDLVWTAGSDEPVPTPDGASFVFPYASDVGARDGLDSWNLSGAPRPLYWSARPFGIGTATDGLVALHSPPLRVLPGETVQFLDHAVQLTGFLRRGDGHAAAVDIFYAGTAAWQRLGTGFPLQPGAPGSEDALVDAAGVNAKNVRFADRAQATVTAPDLFGGGSDDDDDAWFVLVEDIETDGGDNATAATIRVGRLVAARAPLNAMFVDRALYVVEAHETAEGLVGLTWTQWVPVGGDFRFRAAALDVAGVQTGERLPILLPFRGPHVEREDLRPPLRRDANGFLQETTPGNGVIGTAELALAVAARTPADRAHRAPPLVVRWMETGEERGGLVTFLDAGDPGRLATSRRVPFRYASFALAPGPYLVDSELFGDASVLTSTGSRPGPRGPRSWVYEPEKGPFLMRDEDGLRLYGATWGEADAADVLVAASAILRAGDHPGHVRAPGLSAHEELAIALRYEPYHRYRYNGLGPVAVSDESLDRAADLDNDDDPVDAAADGDNLFDVHPRNDDPALGDLYGPALIVRYRMGLRSIADLAPIPMPLGPGSLWLVPAADRDPRHPGLDSFDLDGDGDDDPVIPRGFWDIDRAGPPEARLATTGTFSPAGAPAAADLLWLQTQELTLGIGADAQLLDHDVRLVAFDPVAERARFDVRDHQAAAGPDVVATIDVHLDGPRCIKVRNDHAVAAVAAPCGDMAASSAAGAPPGPNDALWWAELVSADGDRVVVRLNRFVTHVDRPAAGDVTRFAVGGHAYRWTGVEPASGEVPSLGALSFDAIVPIGSAPGLVGMSVGGLVPLLPPFFDVHTALLDFGLGLERDAYGFADADAEPDADALAGAAPERVFSAGALHIQLERREQERAFRFVHLDPVRALDRARAPGIAFVGGQFAEPLDGWSGPGAGIAVDRLKVGGPDGFEEAIYTSDDRGWDHYVSLRLTSDRGKYLVDSARLADLRTMQLWSVADGTLDPLALGWPRVVDRASGFWMFDAAAGRDLYVHAPTTLAPPGGGDGGPVVDPPAPVDNVTSGPGRGKDGPASPAWVSGIVLVVVVLCARRWRWGE